MAEIHSIRFLPVSSSPLASPTRQQSTDTTSIPEVFFGSHDGCFAKVSINSNGRALVDTEYVGPDVESVKSLCVHGRNHSLYGISGESVLYKYAL